MLKWREEIEYIELIILRDDMQFYKVVSWYENLKGTLDCKEFKDYSLTLGLNLSIRSASWLWPISEFPFSLPLLAYLDIPFPEWILWKYQIPLYLWLCPPNANFKLQGWNVVPFVLGLSLSFFLLWWAGLFSAPNFL